MCTHVVGPCIEVHTPRERPRVREFAIIIIVDLNGQCYLAHLLSIVYFQL